MGHIRLSDPPPPPTATTRPPPTAGKNADTVYQSAARGACFSMAATADCVAVNIAAFRPLVGFICRDASQPLAGGVGMNQMQTCAEPPPPLPPPLPPPFLCMQDDCTSRSELMRNAVREAGAYGGMCEPARRQRRIIGSSWHKWHSCRGASGVSGGVSSFLFRGNERQKFAT